MNQPGTVPGSRLGQEGTAGPHHACDPATLPRAGLWGPARVSGAPGRCLSYGVVVSGNGVDWGLRCFAGAALLRGAVGSCRPRLGWVSPRPGDSRGDSAELLCGSHHTGDAVSLRRAPYRLRSSFQALQAACGARRGEVPQRGD